MKIKIQTTVDIDPAAWTLNYGIEGSKDIREDVRKHYANLIHDAMVEAGVEVAPTTLSWYCPSCEHPWGYHTTQRGCTMPLDVHGLPVSRTADTLRSCGCGEMDL